MRNQCPGAQAAPDVERPRAPEAAPAARVTTRLRDVRWALRRVLPDDGLTRLLMSKPIEVNRKKLALTWSLVTNLVYYERVRFAHPRLTAARPEGIAIEITNACNLRCTMCNLVEMRRRPRLMSLDVYRAVIERCVAAGIGTVRLHTYGETLMHPQLPEMLAHARSRGLTVWISTNGQLLDEAMGRAILEAGVSCVRYSVEGGSRETYERIRARGKWDVLLANMRRFRELRDALSPATRIGLNTVVMRSTLGDLEKMAEVFGPYVDEIEYSPLEGLGRKGLGLAESEWLEKPDLDRRLPCRLLWEMMNVSVDGKATLCCADVEAEAVVGDVLEQDLVTIWRGPKLERVRQSHRDGRFTGICSTCTFGATNTAATRFRYALINERHDFGRGCAMKLGSLDADSAAAATLVTIRSPPGRSASSMPATPRVTPVARFDFVQKLSRSPAKVAAVVERELAAAISTIYLDLNTNVCNHSCHFCDGFYRETHTRQLPEERVLRLVGEMEDLGVQAVVLAGDRGEPLLYPAFESLLERLNRSPIAYGLYTNGTVRRGRTFELLRGASWIRVSADAATAATHRAMHVYRREHDFARLLEHLGMLVAQASEVGVSFILDPLNYREIAVAADLYLGLGVRTIQIKPKYLPDYRVDVAWLRSVAGEIQAQLLSARSTWGERVMVNNQILDLLAGRGVQPIETAPRTCLTSLLRLVISTHGCYSCTPYRGEDDRRIGDILQQSLREVVTSAARAALLGRPCARLCCYHDQNEALLQIDAGVTLPRSEPIGAVTLQDRFL